MKTRKQKELELLEKQIASLKEQIAAEDGALAGATQNMRELAIALHNDLCTQKHPIDCKWGLDPADNDPDSAEWTKDMHKEWLQRAQKGVELLKQIGFEVVDPDEVG